MFEAVVIGASAGGMQALKTLLSALPASFPLPIAVVQHIEQHSDAYLAEFLDRASAIDVREAEDKQALQTGTAYLAPAGYHLLIEPDRSFSLSIDEKVNYCRPSIDLLFESAADAYGENLVGIVLTGANADGAKGLKAVKKSSGLAVVQNPKTAQSSYMPQAAINIAPVDHILDLEKIAPLLVKLTERHSYATGTQG
jgi:two-component system, chemotaxis family, protein-glutamate methylesterase/glutaminase